MTEASPAVAGRECGECVACCQYLPIDTEEIQLMPGTLCPHCVDHKGCTIYETRPQVCRTHFCGWRMSLFLDDSWRPDKSGVLITPVSKNIPSDYMQEGLEFLLTHPHIAVAKPDFYQILHRAVSAKVPLFLALPGPPDSISNSTFMNTVLEPALEPQYNEAFMKTVDDTLLMLKTAPFKPCVLRNKKA